MHGCRLGLLHDSLMYERAAVLLINKLPAVTFLALRSFATSLS